MSAVTDHDPDTAGYLVYIGATADGLALYEDVGLRNWITLDAPLLGKVVAVSAYDATGNEGARTSALNMFTAP